MTPPPLIAIVVVFSTFFSQTADGQRLESAAVGFKTRLDTQPTQTLSHFNAATDTTDRRSRLAHDIRVGVVVGVAVGFVAAIISTSSNTDHSWDGFVYAGFISIGALVGLTVGAIVGSTRGP